MEFVESNIELVFRKAELLPLEERLKNITKEISFERNWKATRNGIGAAITVVATSKILEYTGFNVWDIFEYVGACFVGLYCAMLTSCVGDDSNGPHWKWLAKKFQELEKTYNINPLETTSGTENIDKIGLRALSLMYLSNNFSKVKFDDGSVLVNPVKQLPMSTNIPLAYIKNNKLVACGLFNLSKSKVNPAFTEAVEKDNIISYLSYELEDNNPELENNHELVIIDKDKGTINFEMMSGVISYLVKHSTQSYITKDNNFLVVQINHMAKEYADTVTKIDPSKSSLDRYQRENLTRLEWVARIKNDETVQ